MKSETDIIREIEASFLCYRDTKDSIGADTLERKWAQLTRNEPSRFINNDGTVNVDAMRNFRKRFIFVPDDPVFNPAWWNIKNVGGGRRGTVRLLKDSLQVLIQDGYTRLLEKYPCFPVGAPFVFKHRGYAFTHRWNRHIYLVGLLNKVMGNLIKDEFITLDIGSSYGIFSHILKNEFPNTHCILMDFPEQLLLAHYFIAMNNPHARIASFKEVFAENQLGKDFFRKYDYILVPISRYLQITAASIDMVTNFVSFAEMNRHWFEYYMNNEPFTSARFFFTMNRFVSAPEYDSDITILDYHLEKFSKLHFGICRLFGYAYKRKWLFSYRRRSLSSQFFEFIGERR